MKKAHTHPKAPQAAPTLGSGGKAASPAPKPAAAAGGEPAPAEKLTPEEQMERFAQELKDKDWGHQPC